MGLFGIGVYQSISGGTTYGGGFPTKPFQLLPWASGVYGGTYGYVLNTRIRAPQSTQYTPAQEIGSDTIGTTVMRGYPSMTWNYSTMRPDYWYQLYQQYVLSGMTYPGYGYLVLLQYPDTTGQMTQVLARWDPPIQSFRDVGSYQGVQLHFTYLGQLQLNPGVAIQVLS